MVSSHALPDVAHASILVPSSLAHQGNARQDVFLRQVAADHFRWFHADGTQTVVEGNSVAHALHVAELVWHEVELLIPAPD